MEPYEELEQRFGEWAHVENVVGCSSGTAALQLAFETLNLPKGSTVLVPDFGMIAIPRAAKMAGLRIHAVDCDPLSLNMDYRCLPVCLSGNVSAIVAVATYGRRVDSRVFEYAFKHNIPVIEDLAEAHGIQPDKRSAAVCWSFYKNKVIAGEEGGAVSFKDRLHADRARMLRCLGFTPDHDFSHIPGGFNARLSNAHARLILDSLHRYPSNLTKRNDMVDLYDELIPIVCRRPVRDVPWVYDVRLPDGIPNQGVSHIVQTLSREGVFARHGFKPIRSQEEFFEYFPIDSESRKAYGSVFYLSLDPSLSMREVRRAAISFHSLISYS